MDEYRQHSSVTARWNGDALEPVLPGADELVTVWFVLPDTDGPRYWEGLLTEPIGSDLFIIRAVPAHAYDVNYGDTVSATPSAEGALVCTSITKRSHNITFRIWLAEGSLTAWETVAETYARAGCLIDVISPRLLALSCPETLSQTIADRLQDDENSGTFQYETGAR